MAGMHTRRLVGTLPRGHSLLLLAGQMLIGRGGCSSSVPVQRRGGLAFGVSLPLWCASASAGTAKCFGLQGFKCLALAPAHSSPVICPDPKAGLMLAEGLLPSADQIRISADPRSILAAHIPLDLRGGAPRGVSQQARGVGESARGRGMGGLGGRGGTNKEKLKPSKLHWDQEG